MNSQGWHVVWRWRGDGAAKKVEESNKRDQDSRCVEGEIRELLRSLQGIVGRHNVQPEGALTSFLPHSALE